MAKVMTVMAAAVAQIAWTENKVGAVSDVVVFDGTATTELERARYRKRFPHSAGASSPLWMAEGGDPRATPEGVFMGWLSESGIANEILMLYALDQLGQIEEAGWARTMAAALRANFKAAAPEDLPLVQIFGANPDYLEAPTYERSPAILQNDPERP